MYYFDNSATTKPTPEILNIYQKVSLNYFGNPSSAHKLGEEAKALMTSARKQIAAILGFESNEIYFASSGTEVNNWVMQPILKAIKQIHPNRNKVLISSIEHPATMKQIPLLESLGYQVELIKVDANGQIDLAHFETLLDNEVLLVSVMGVNNEVGAIQPVKEMATFLQKYPQVIWHMDGVQTITSQIALLREPRIDMITLSSHKFHSVRGVGILAQRQRVPNMPLLHGGGQETGRRSSTENLAGIVATSRALRKMNEIQADTKERLATYRGRIIETLKNLDWQVFAETTSSEHIVCAALAPVPGEVLLHALEAHDIFVSTTSACASRSHQEHATLKAMEIPDEISKSAIRLSMAHSTTDEDVDYLLKTLEQVTEQFKNYA
ncbi:MAG: cysteine desulfurase family protein [Ruoffia tabacinasalis]|uniref:cysteine desulfurase family protein n=1 Tax=unclassified Ruoffia TaxID=2862149 RepID=UPI000EE887A1|nr:cysteine desulfurase [Aerococcaceae bacterium]